jgi:hypothetical protein
MAIAGIDPGKDGAVVVIAGPSFAPEIHRYVTPMLGEGRREYDLQRMRGILLSHTLEHVALERQQPMSTRGQFDGSKQAFGTGLGYGLWMGLLSGLAIPFEVVISKTWQKVMHKDVMGPDTKTKSALVAQRLHPTIDWRRSTRCKGPHDGLVDAFCIAEWARRRLATHRPPEMQEVRL